jgi:hypothetical protein
MSVSPKPSLFALTGAARPSLPAGEKGDEMEFDFYLLSRWERIKVRADIFAFVSTSRRERR